jgi:hypothetical protein
MDGDTRAVRVRLSLFATYGLLERRARAKTRKIHRWNIDHRIGTQVTPIGGFAEHGIKRPKVGQLDAITLRDGRFNLTDDAVQNSGNCTLTIALLAGNRPHDVRWYRASLRAVARLFVSLLQCP